MSRALVIGSQTGGLQGVNLDAQRMKVHLEKRGFVADLRVDAQACRAGILEGYERIIRDAALDEPAVVYYSGHGARAEDPRYASPAGTGAHVRRYVQSIVPFDWNQSTDEDFRGILAEELSIWLARLTEKTRNVAVFLDCCHAAMMSRDACAVPKSLPDPLRVGVASCLDALAKEHSLAALAVRSNPDAVRLVAARAEQSAYELPGADGLPRGVFTAALLLAFDEVGDRAVSWQTLGERVREMVLAEHPAQRPEIEGPAERQIFGLAPPPERRWQPIRKRDGAVLLPLGLAQGVHLGDEYVLMPDGADEIDEARRVGAATVSRASATEAWLALEPANLAVPDTSRAFQVGWAVPLRHVVVQAEGAERAAIVDALAKEPLVEIVAAPPEPPARPVATVRARDGHLELYGRLDRLAVSPEPLSPTASARLAANVRQMIHAQAVREIEGTGIDGMRDDDLLVEWGLVEDGKPLPLASAGAVVSEKDSLYLRIRNLGPRRLYVSILDIGLAEGVDLLSAPETSGICLEPQQEEILDRDRVTGALQPMPFTWPAQVPRDGLRPEELLVFATTAPCDLSALLSGGVRGKSRDASRLRQLLEQSAHGGTRNFCRVRPRAPDGFIVKRVALEGSPWEVQRGDAAFLVDDRRPLADVMMQPRRGSPPEKIALRLTDIVIHKNRALFSAEVRVDVLVITRAPEGAGAPYRAETLRFPRIAADSRLPLDNVLVFHGAVHDFVDLCVWVSRDRKDSLSLADLLKAKGSSDEVKGALTSLLVLTAVAPQAGAIVAAVGGAATLAAIGYQLLAAATGDSIGLYRTSFLAQEQFGLGRHPRTGLMRAQDFSFGYEVGKVG